MRRTAIALEDFRSYSSATIALAPGLTAFIGPNGAGKTNLLEAVHVVARGDSSRAGDDAEMIRWGASVARVAVETASEDGASRWLEVTLFAPAPEARRRSRRFAEKRDRERWQGTTLVGPHREDLAVALGERPLPTFASRGEQRTAVLALKLAEAQWLRAHTGTPPVFLLDDVLSELDTARREALAGALPDDAQALLTAAIPTSLPERMRERATLVPVALGAVG